jgi:hypothetical protein
MPKPKSQVKEVLLALWILGGGIYLLVWWLFFSGSVLATPKTNAPNRVALTAMHREITLGDTYEAAMETFYRHRTGTTKLLVLKPQLLRVNTPLELGARNWVLLIEFEGGKVSAVRMRESDFASTSPQVPSPLGSPKDKASQSAQKTPVGL